MTRSEVHRAITHPDTAALALVDAVGLAVAHLEITGAYSDLAGQVVAREMARCALYLGHHGVEVLADVTEQAMEDWFQSATNRHGGWGAPSPSTVRARATAARCLFRCLRSLHITNLDPTIDIALPPRTGLGTRPLTDDEIGLCRLVAAHTLTETRRPAILALAEATATTTEQALVLRRHVHLDERRVLLVGNRKRQQRWGHLTEWGAGALGKALSQIPDDPNSGVVYAAQASVSSGASAVSQALAQVLAEAGIGSESDVRPGSIPAWAARRIFDETGRIEIAAERLGVNSLDTAAAAIGWRWR